MKRFLWVMALGVSSVAAYGQRTEFSVQAGSGLFSFGGTGAVSETGLYAGGDLVPSTTVLGNPYGRSSGFSYSITGQIQRIARSTFIYGAQAGYESLTSRVAVTTYSGGFGGSITTAVDGRATLQNHYVNIHPFAGKRFGNQRVGLDVTVGADMGFGLSSHEHSELKGPTGYYTTTDTSRPIPAVDVRPRLNLTGYYHAFGLSLGYSQGLTNYASTRYSDRRAYSHGWRVGVVYRLSSRV